MSACVRKERAREEIIGGQSMKRRLGLGRKTEDVANCRREEIKWSYIRRQELERERRIIMIFCLIK